MDTSGIPDKTTWQSIKGDLGRIPLIIINVKEIIELTRAAEKLAGNKEYLLLSDARVNLTLTTEARKVAAAKKKTPLLIANAVLINNLALRIVANFFKKVNKPHFKFRVFTSEEKAHAWLLKCKK